MTKLTCIVCGAEFESVKKTRQYCSQQCRNLWAFHGVTGLRLRKVHKSYEEIQGENRKRGDRTEWRGQKCIAPHLPSYYTYRGA